jgi:palmitoyltransferase ZDHHC13/17
LPALWEVCGEDGPVSAAVRSFMMRADNGRSHCPWVDNCVAVNNHKHFILYVMFMVTGICLLIPLTIACKLISPTTVPPSILIHTPVDVELLPEPTVLHCTILKDAFCAQFSKDTFTIITNSWGALQLTWTFMLLFVHLTQIARNITTYETMKGAVQAGPLMAAVTAGTMSVDGAQLDGPEAGVGESSAHGHGHSHKKKEGFLSQWSKLLGIDTFITVAFQGYKGSRSKAERTRQRKSNPWTRGVLRNCQDFWGDGPVMVRRGPTESTKARLGGEDVDYAFVYDVPGGDSMQYRGAYESVGQADDGDV